MAKVRVYQLAKELKVQSALVLGLLDRLGQDVKSDLSTLDEKTANLVRDLVIKAIDVEKERILEERRAEEAAEVQPVEEVEAEAAAPADPVEPVAAEAVGGEAPAEPTPEVETPAAAIEAPSTEAPATEAPAADEVPAESPVAAADTAPVSPPSPEKTPLPPKQEVPAVDLPAAARPLAPRPTSPAARVAKPAPKKPAPQTAASRRESAAAAAAAAGAVAGKLARKPRVFPARRIPTPGQPLVRPKPAPAAATPGAARPARPGATAPPPNRMRPAPGPTGAGAKKRRKKDKKRERRPEITPAARPPKELPPVPAEIKLSEGVTVKELAEKLNRKSKDVIAKLIPRGVLATINQPLDPTVAIDVAKEFGSEATIISFEEEAQTAARSAEAGQATDDAADIPTEVDSAESLEPRPPVVTVMGHVDHGKTSLLDAIRATDVVESEAGGITQHIGAYQVEERGRKITFLDTPGHEAFTMMRSRGAKATDVVVLVVAADDGVKPQTLEAIDHARAAGVPMVVAINKIDKANANVDRVKQQLADRELLVEDYGGDIVSCEVSAKKRTGLDALLEMILLVADMGEIKANPNKKATGVVLEARLDRARGVLATVLVQTGTLKAGDPFIAGSAHGKVRAMVDDHGRRIKVAGPSTPVEVMGFADEPAAGDSFQALADESKARQIANFRQEKERAERQKASARRTLENLSADIAAGSVKDLPILLKTDVQGSVEALQKSLSDLPSDKVRISILRSSIGAITQADVLLAAASNAIIVGFNVRPDKAAAEVARQEGVELRMYTVIYDVVDDIKSAMVGMLEPTFREQVLGQAEVRQLFRVPKLGVIAGCYITDGKVTRSSELRLLRDNVVIFTGKVGSLRRFKDDVSEVKNGYECGIGIANYNDLKEGDVIESFVMEKVHAKTL